MRSPSGVHQSGMRGREPVEIERVVELQTLDTVDAGDLHLVGADEPRRRRETSRTP